MVSNKIFDYGNASNCQQKTLEGTTKKQLYSCRAWIYENYKYIVLQSYGTIIFVIDKRENVMYCKKGLGVNYVTTNYGEINGITFKNCWSATTSQHMHKFLHWLANERHYSVFSMDVVQAE